ERHALDRQEGSDHHEGGEDEHQRPVGRAVLDDAPDHGLPPPPRPAPGCAPMPAIAALRRLSESIRNDALDTTVSPSATPLRIWIRSPSGSPVQTMRGSKWPPAWTMNT